MVLFIYLFICVFVYLFIYIFFLNEQFIQEKRGMQ